MTEQQLNQLFTAVFPTIIPGGPTNVTRANPLLQALRQLIVSAVLKDAFPGVNDRPDGWKFVAYYDQQQAGWTNGETTLADLDPRKMCQGATARVIFGENGMPDYLRLVYDPQSPQTLPLVTWADGRMAGGANLVQCKWVPLDSPEARVRAFLEDPAGYNYAEGDYRRGFVNDATEEQFFVRLADGPAAPPTTVAGDANWRHVAGTDVPADAGYTAFQRITQAVAIDFLDNGVVTAGRLYAITIGSQEVWVWGLDNGAFSGSGEILDPANPERTLRVDVDVRTGTVTPTGGGGGASQVQDGLAPASAVLAPSVNAVKGALVYQRGTGTRSIVPVLGGNLSAGTDAGVALGASNQADGSNSGVGSGTGNYTSPAADSSVVAGGSNIRITSYNSGVLCGYNIRLDAALAGVGSGHSINIGSGGALSYVGGGQGHNMNASRGFIGAGYNISVTGDMGAATGGEGHSVSGHHGFVGGGWGHISSGSYSAVYSGYGNTAAGAYSSANGRGNVVAGDDCHAYGCTGCTISADCTKVVFINCHDFTVSGVANATYYNNALVPGLAPSIVEALTETQLVPSAANPYVTAYESFIDFSYSGNPSAGGVIQHRDRVDIAANITYALSASLPGGPNPIFLLKAPVTNTGPVTITWSVGSVDGATTTVMQPGEWRLIRKVGASMSAKTYETYLSNVPRMLATDIEIADVTKGVIMTVGGTRVRARIAGTAGARTWTFDEL